MPSSTEPADETQDDDVMGDDSPEMIAALFRALEAVDADVSPELACTVQAIINVVKHIGREFGCLTESEALAALGQGTEPEVHDFTLRYGGQILYPLFLFEPSVSRLDHDGPVLLSVSPGAIYGLSRIPRSRWR